MNRFFLTLSAVLLTVAAFAQTRTDLYGRFREAASDYDEDAFKAVIADWEKLYPNDAELFSVNANYYFMLAMDEVMVFSDEEPADRESMAVEDEDGNVRYMSSVIQFDQKQLDQATGTLAKGIAKFPDRVDLRLGKVSMHLNANEYGAAVQEVKSALERSVVNKNKWTGTLDDPVESDGVAFLRDCVQDYLSALLEADELPAAEDMIDTAVKLYPKDAIFLTDKASVRYFSGDLQNALKYFLSAQDCAPDDLLITNNIAHVYEELGDTQNALKTYRKLVDDRQYGRSASNAIKRLENK